jgi:hypothetical protein
VRREVWWWGEGEGEWRMPMPWVRKRVRGEGINIWGMEGGQLFPMINGEQWPLR